MYTVHYTFESIKKKKDNKKELKRATEKLKCGVKT